MKQSSPLDLTKQSELTFNPIWLNALFAHADRVWVGFSGGVDSQVLLHALLQQVSKEQKQKLAVLHVHHGLSANADAWLENAEQICQQHALHFEYQKVRVSSASSLEEAAREARYQVFEDVLSAQDVLLLAHHQDDQAETILFRLLRGTGGRGLTGMPQMRKLGQQGAYLYRPLLQVTKAQILHYAQKHKLQWVEDESNQDDCFSRNFLRHNILPKLQTHFTKASQNVVASADKLRQDYLVLTELAAEKLAHGVNEFGGLSVEWLVSQSQTQHEFWLREYLITQDISLTLSQRLNLLTMLASSTDKQPQCDFPLGRLMRHQGYLYCLPVEQPVQYGSLILGQKYQRAFDQLTLLSAHNVELKPRPLGAKLLQTNGQHRELKKWLNDQQIPVWWREHLPYLFIQDELVAIGNLWRHPAYSSLQVNWQIDPSLPLPIKQASF
ncbi:tRNA lysidine(34) synthetase TilS [Marinomonas sp. THO17]|uniref:tRNA lysidine(34) synthetase TilS n=1 Tax=Marinomonas sp. THO17 TaxID=3149048 RepID=UPI00336C0185